MVISSPKGYFQSERKSGHLVTPRAQKIWGSGIFMPPEILEEWFSHMPRKSVNGRAVFSITQKICGCGDLTFTENIWGCDLFIHVPSKCPETLGVRYLYVASVFLSTQKICRCSTHLSVKS